MGKNCFLGLEYGPRPRTQDLGHSFFAIRTSRPVNNIYLSFTCANIDCVTIFLSSFPATCKQGLEVFLNTVVDVSIKKQTLEAKRTHPRGIRIQYHKTGEISFLRIIPRTTSLW